MFDTYNKRKIINDPVHGFITIPDELSYDLIGHKYFQRLRRIKQLGLTSLVYPGANHSRFHHALGAMHLMMLAVDSLRMKNVPISEEDALAAYYAILLHDIGHGPFSHALEYCIVQNIDHEDLTRLFMSRMNQQFEGRLDKAIQIFENQHPLKFLHQLVSGQLDVDRLDYLTRDSFFTGVSEGIIGTERIIKMLNVSDNNLVAEIKGIYSIEKFLISRRMMYWQVYLHKTVISAEKLLVKILHRAEYLLKNGTPISIDENLKIFLKDAYTVEDFKNNPELLDAFATIDDNDIVYTIKQWTKHPDKVLSQLCHFLIDRKLFKVSLQEKPFDPNYIENLKQKVKLKYNLNDDEVSYFIFSDKISNKTYSSDGESIKILFQDNSVTDVSEASEQLKHLKTNQYTTKYYLCHPKGLNLQ
ncbi:MAG: HD domain-containing protein [Bacteroidales bacterium]|nr:HD domain-containing protein [Bacteroidales bacterium]